MHPDCDKTMRHFYAFSLLVPSYQAGLDFYVGVLGFSVMEDHRINAYKRWLVIAPETECTTNIILAKATTEAQISAIGQQTGGRVGFFLNSNNFDADYAAMRAAGVLFEQAPREESYGRVAVWQDPFGNRWDLLQRNKA